MGLAGLTGALQGIGEAGGQVAQGKLDAQAAKLKALMDSFKMQSETVNIADTQERLRRLKLQPDTEEDALSRRLAGYEKVLGKPLTPQQKEALILGTPPQTGETIEDAEKHLGRKLTEEEMQRWYKIAPPKGPAGRAPKVDKTYDPSGHLRTAYLDPETAEVVAWGPLVPEREAFHYITDTEGNVHAVRMPTVRAVTPGEIRQSEKAAKQWEEIAPKEHKPLPKTMVKPTGTAQGGTGAPKSDVIGQTAPKYTPPLQNALKSAQAGYKNWLASMKNSEFHTPKTDLAIVFSAVRSQVEGAGRMTNTELERELKAGSFGDRFQRWYKGATEGTLPDDQRQDLINVIRDSWLASAETARAAWQSDMPDKEMPIYIKADNLDDLAVKVKH
jgi:hypothetical protein